MLLIGFFLFLIRGIISILNVLTASLGNINGKEALIINDLINENCIYCLLTGLNMATAEPAPRS